MREDGYYWVKVTDEQEYAPAKFSAGWWDVPTLKYLIPDDRLHEIDERRIVREVE